MICEKCGEKIEDDAVFCPNCGAKLTSKSVCATCGSNIEEEASFCSQCGSTQVENNLDSHKKKPKNRKMKIAIIVLVCIIIAIIGMLTYRITSIHSARSTVMNYCTALKEFDFEKLNKYSSSELKAVESDSEVNKVIYDFLKANAAHIDYAIGDVKIFDKNWDKITISTRFEYNNASNLLEQAFYKDTAEFISNNGSYTSEYDVTKQSVDIFKNELKVDRTERDEKTLNFVCIKNKENKEPKWIISETPEDIELILTGNIDKIRSSENDSNSTTADEPDRITSYSEIEVSTSYIEPLELAGEYNGEYPNSSAEISIFSSPEDNVTVGNATFFVGGNASSMAANYLEGEFKKVDKNIYTIVGDDVRSNIIGVDYSTSKNCICLYVYIDGYYQDTYYLVNHYES